MAGCQAQSVSSTTSSDNQTSKTNSSEAGSEEIVTIEFYGFRQNPSNSYFKWQQDYFAEKIGVNVAIIPADSERLQPMLSAGNLPDMGCYAVNGSLSQAIQGGHLLDLTPYEKEISNFTEKWPEAAQYSKDYMSNGTGKLYGLPGALGRPNSFALNTGTYATQVRWDIYEKAGKPEVTDMYSFLDAAVKMKEVYPTTEDGLETYMIGLFPDGGAGGLFINPAYKWLEVSGVCGINDVATYDLVNNKLEYIFDKNSAFYQGLKWIATANRMGLVDPDSMTQTYEITHERGKSQGIYALNLGRPASGSRGKANQAGADKKSIRHQRDHKKAGRLPEIRQLPV